MYIKTLPERIDELEALLEKAVLRDARLHAIAYRANADCPAALSREDLINMVLVQTDHINELYGRIQTIVMEAPVDVRGVLPTETFDENVGAPPRKG